MKPWQLLVGLLMPLTAFGHEFWMRAEPHRLGLNQPTSISLRVGERFEGDLVGFGQPVVRSLQRHHRGGTQDLQARVPLTAQAGFTMAFSEPGAHLLALDTHGFHVELPAAEFERYLKEEGLEPVIAVRQAQGASTQPGRERYRRHIKALFLVNGHTDASHAVRTGQTLEIVPLDDPHTLGQEQPLRVLVLHERQPLRGALLKAWHRDTGQLLTHEVRTDAQGLASVRLPAAGRWMLSVVHMVPTLPTVPMAAPSPSPADQTPAIDWDSHWASITFERPSQAPMSMTPGAKSGIRSGVGSGVRSGSSADGR